MTRRHGAAVALAALVLAALVAVAVLLHQSAAPPTTASTRSASSLAVARCEAVIGTSQSVIWTRPVVTPSVLEAAGADPAVAAQWQAAATPGQIARHDDEVPRFRLVGAGPTGSGTIVELESSLTTHGGPITGWWGCRVAGGRVVELTESGA